MVTESSRARYDRRSLGAFGRKLACLSVVLPVLLLAAPAHSASLINSVGPRLPTNIGPRGPMIDSIGPRFDPGLHSGGNGQGGGYGGGTTTNANTSSGGNSASGHSG